MNAGRLHAVLEQIKQDYEKNEILGRLKATVDALSASISSVTEANATAFRSALSELYAGLGRSPTASATPSELEIINEIGASDKVGLGLRAKIEKTLDSNNVTPANALAELQKILEVITHFQEVVLAVVDGFEALKVPYERLEPGESEVGVLVPWAVVHSNLEGVQKELHRFDNALKLFGELVEDNPESPEIRSVGSSTLQVFINSTPGIALCIAAAIERLCALYKQILEIKLLRKQIREKSLPENVSAAIEAHEEQVAEKGIDKIVEGLIREFGKKRDKERLNELRTGLRTALRFLAAQIDAGVSMEVRSEPPRARDVAESVGEDVKSAKTKRALEKARKIAAQIERASVAMRALKRASEPILALESPGEKKQGRGKRETA